MVTCAPTACKHKVSGSFSLPSRGSFHLSLTVLYAIGHWVVFSLGGWSLLLHTGFHVSGATLDTPQLDYISRTGLLPSAVALSRALPLCILRLIGVHNPEDKSSVWALPISLAATLGIEVSFSSSGYLDVSVPRVSFTRTIDSYGNDWTLLQPGCPIR